MKNTLALALAAAGLSQVSATFIGAPSFSCPGNTDNQCTDKQSAGFDFSDLVDGAVGNYGGFVWSGFTCKTGFSKRDELGARTFSNSKCISGSANTQKSSSPSFGCDASSGVDKTSVGEFHVYPEFDCDLEFHYDMPDGSTCKHRSACSSSGSVVKNTQCGGAKNVTIVYPSQPSKPKPTCSFAVPSISFSCGSASSTKTVSTVASYSTSKVETTTTKSHPVSSSTHPASVPSSTAPGSQTYSVTIPVQTPGSSSYPASSAKTTTSSVAESSSVVSSYSTKPETETTSSKVETTSSVVDTTSSKVETTSSVVDTTSSAVETTSSVVETTSSVVETTSSVVDTTSSAVETTSSVVETTSSVVDTTSSKVETTASSNEATYSVTVPTSSATEATTFTSVTSYLTTSTVLTTVVSTVTSCAETVTNCPAHSTVLTTATIALTTTICPVTETLTLTSSQPAATQPGSAVETSSNAAVTGPSSVVATSSTVAVSSGTSPAVPVETLPCPDVVPSCLNTWMFSVGCKDNSDASCYCPDEAFVQNVFSCLYAHGESDEVVSEAVSYFQGICGAYVGQNPGIATGAETITTYLTDTATAPAAATYTTIYVDITTVVPCTTDLGSTISTIASSSSTIIISTAVTVPQVVLTTATAGATDVGVVPGTYTAVVPTTAAVTATKTGAVAPYPTGTGIGSTLITAQPSGTGAYTTSKAASATTVPIATAGAAHIGSGLGFLGFVALFAAL